MKTSLFRAVLTSICFSALASFGQITLECDFTSSESRGKPMRYLWDVSNRISPMGRFNMPIGENPYICVVRPLGGKSRNDQKVIAEDTYKWDGEKYYYDWAPLKKQIDTVRAKARVFQLLIDNPPWAFQRGIDFKGQPEVETYGNAWPPNDPNAWSVYIQDMLRELVKTYGREEVERWRYCIGREIGTGGHWRAGKEEFFEHYKNTEAAIRSVLPTAKVGTHFLWASSKHSFGPDFVRWCVENDARYDFVGVSYYPFYNRINRVDIEHVYRADFAPIKDIPEWSPAATLEIHEFALIKSMSKRGNSFENAPKAHQESFTVMLAKMMYEHDMVHVFRWGSGENKVAERTFRDMRGDVYFSSSKQGAPSSSGRMVDAVFSLSESNQQYNVMAYNYNVDPNAGKSESVQIMTKFPALPSTEMKYRVAEYTSGGLEWSDWKTRRTKGVSGSDGSMLEFEIELEPFSFQKIEMRSTSAGIKRVVTNRETGAKTEVELIDVKRGNLICRAKGRRFVIPVATLSDEDLAFLKKWVLEK